MLKNFFISKFAIFYKIYFYSNIEINQHNPNKFDNFFYL